MKKKFTKWFKEHKEAIATTALAVAGVVSTGALTYAGIVCVSAIKKSSQSLATLADGSSNTDLDITIPSAGQTTAWHENEDWNNAILSDVALSDIGQIGKEVKEAFGLSEDTLVNLVMDIPAKN